MNTVGVSEAKTNLSRLLNQISKGERIVITRYGTAIAVLQPLERMKTGDPLTTISEIRDFRKQHSLGGFTIRELIEDRRQ